MKVDQDLLHIVLQVNQSKISHWNPRQKTVGHPRVVRGAMHSGKKWRSALWLNARSSDKKWWIREFAIPFCCGASVASGQQHSQDLRRVIKGSTNSRIHHFLPKCIAINQSALRHFLPECIAPRTTRGCHTIFSPGFQWERFNSGYVLLWFTCKTMWRSSSLTFHSSCFCP